MTNPKPKYSARLIIVTSALVIAAAIAFYFYWDTTKKMIRNVLEEKFTIFLLWVIIVTVFIVHYWRHKSKDVVSEAIITKKFGMFIDNFLGGVAYATTVSTSLTLIKGLYVQKFFSDKVYFLEFQDLDLMTIFGVTLFLLYVSVMKIVEIAKDTYKIEHTEQVLNEHGEIVAANTSGESNSGNTP